MTLRQDTRFPDEDTSRLRISTRGSDTLHAQNPASRAWAPAIDVRVNGRPVQQNSSPSSYLDVTRTWADGDTVAVRMPMTLRVEPMPDDATRAAILYGPLVLAGDLGPHDDAAWLEPDYVPALLTGTGRLPHG